MFDRLSSRRGHNGFGPALITYHDLAAFTAITGLRLSPWEVDIIEMLDELWLAEYFRSRSNTRGETK